MKCEHVILPTTPNPEKRKIKESLRGEVKTWKQVENLFEMPKWFVQPILAYLCHVGESSPHLEKEWIPLRKFVIINPFIPFIPMCESMVLMHLIII